MLPLSCSLFGQGAIGFHLGATSHHPVMVFSEMEWKCGLLHPALSHYK